MLNYNVTSLKKGGGQLKSLSFPSGILKIAKKKFPEKKI